MVVEPVTADGDPAPATIWIPPGRWIDYFTGKVYTGPSAQTLSVGLSQMPVLVRAGSIIPTEPYAPSTPAAPQRTLTLTAYSGANGSFELYDDQGVGFGYTRHAYTWTPISYAERRGRTTLTVGRAKGWFPGALRRRSWVLRLVGIRRPRAVLIDGRRQRKSRWSYDAASRTLSVATGAVRTDRRVTIVAF
jgi:hypothetical protein